MYVRSTYYGRKGYVSIVEDSNAVAHGQIFPWDRISLDKICYANLFAPKIYSKHYDASDASESENK